MTASEASSFGVALRQLRLAAGLTQEALAERAGISAKAVSELERDPARSPRLDTVRLLANALRLDPDGRASLLAAARPNRSQSDALRPTAPALPRPLTPLFGRAGVVEAIAELVRRGGSQADALRLLVLTGPGGVGKTRLAIAAAERVVGDFVDGAVFVDLAPLRDPDLVLATIARHLAVDERDPLPLPERLTAALRRRHLILVLDNFEHLLPAREQVLALLEACPNLFVLATSRVAMRVRGEREYRVAPLELPDATGSVEDLVRSPAVALFLDRARAVGTELDAGRSASTVAEICLRLDGLPLAIELAAAWTRLLAPSALLGQLDHRLPLLVDGPHDLPTRQRTMRDAIAWSYELLNPEEQRLFRSLCVFVGGCTVEAARAVSAEDEQMLLLRLASLVDRSLLRSHEAGLDSRGEHRISILETLREFGLEHLRAHGEADELRGRHAAYYLTLAEAAEAGSRGPEHVVWCSRLEAEYGNLRAALDWSVSQGDGTTAIRLTAALSNFWSERGYLSEGRQWLRAALDLSTAMTETPIARARALAGAASLAMEHGFLEEAETLSTQAVALARDLGDSRIVITGLNTQGSIAWQLGSYEEAARRHEEALSLARSVGDRTGVADALSGLASVSARTGQIDRAKTFLGQCLAEYRALGDMRGVATTLKALCVLAMFAGAFDQAEQFGGESLDHLQAVGDTGAAAETLWALGVAAQSQGHDDRAITLHEESLALRRNRGDERGAAKSLAALGATALRQGELGRARSFLSEAVTTLRAYDDPHGRAVALTLLGHAALEEGDLTEAAARLTESADLFQSLGSPLYVPWCLEGLAGLAAEQGKWEQAAQLCGTRDALRTELGSGAPAAVPAQYARTHERSRGALGGDAFALAYETGYARSLAEALTGAVLAARTDKAAGPNGGDHSLAQPDPGT